MICKQNLSRLIKGIVFTIGLGILSMGLLAQPTQAAVGDSIAATFPDVNLAQVVADDLAGIDNLTNLSRLDLYNNELTSIPESIGALSNLKFFYVSNNLLPTNYGDTLNTLGIHFIDVPKVQNKLILGTIAPIIIKSQEDIDNIDYLSFLTLASGNSVSSSHNFILENYIDENNQPVNLNDYIENGIVKQTGKVYAQVRATGTGVFPNNSVNAVTDDFIELNFEVIRYNLSFNLNGGTGTAPATQSLIEGEAGTVVSNPQREGYTFLGWNTEDNGNGISWVPESTLMIKQHVMLYAQWQEKDNPAFGADENTNGGKLQVTGETTGNGLPKTGGYGAMLINIMIIVTGILIIRKGIKKSK